MTADLRARPAAHAGQRDERTSAARLRRAAAEARAAGRVEMELDDPGTAALLTLARAVGAPVAAVLDRAADVAQARADVRDEARVASAQASAVARLMLALPLVAVPGLGALLDLPVGAFFATPIGSLLAGLASAALALAWLWMWLLRRGVDRAASRPPPAAHALELAAVAASAGLPLPDALRRAAAAVEVHDERLAAGLRRLAMADELGVEVALGEDLRDLAGLVDAHRRRGVAVVELLRHDADARLAEHRLAVRERAQRLSAQLVPPLALLVLPATVALVAAPMLAAALDSLG